jgi:hypothetical protein
MAQVHFTSWLRELVPNARPPRTAHGRRGAGVSGRNSRGGYVVDDQGRLRKHVCIFADGTRLQHASALAHQIKPDSQLYVMQALTGG